MRIINSYHQLFRNRSLHSLSRVLPVAALTLGLSACSDGRPGFAETGKSFPLAELNQAQSLAGSKPELAGKTLLINFWATWCAPCRREMPDLQRLSDSLDRSRFAVIGVSVDEDSNLAREFLLQYQIRFTNLLDENQEISSRLLDIRAFPETFIVAPDGVIIKRISGEQVWNEQIFDNLLSRPEQSAINTSGASTYG